MTDATSDPTATDTGDVFQQAQDGEAGQVSRSGLYPTVDDAADEPARGSGEADDDQAPVDRDDPELSGADLDEDQSEGRGPSIEPGA